MVPMVSSAVWRIPSRKLVSGHPYLLSDVASALGAWPVCGENSHCLFFCCDASSLPPRFLLSAWRAAYLPFGASRHLVWSALVPAVSRIFNHGPVGFAPCILRRIWAVSLRFLGCKVFIPQVNMQRVNKPVSVIPRSEATWESVTQKSEMC